MYQSGSKLPHSIKSADVEEKGARSAPPGRAGTASLRRAALLRGAIRWRDKME